MKGGFDLNLKKFSTAVISCIMAGTFLTGCGSENTPKVSDAATTKIGIISKLNASEEALNEHLKKLEEVAKRPDIKLSHYYHYHEGTNALVMGINASNIDEISTYKSVANYIVARNPQFEILNHTENMLDSFCCAVRKEDTKLREDLDSAIESMKNDGTLENLVKTYITDLKGDTEPPAVEIPKIDGAENLKVGITGDLPPLDLILADGTPAGFNTAMIAEISKRINKNIEIVTIESNARAVALQSGKIDIVFWVTLPGKFWYEEDADNAPKDIDKPKELDVTTPYFEDEIIHVGLKK
jgi:polar amino acid transport system substrate-binding protein